VRQATLQLDAVTLNLRQANRASLWSSLGTCFLTAAIILASSAPGSPQSTLPSTQTEARIRRLIDSMPIDDALRLSFEEGNRGDGVHYSWRDLMHSEGVRRALIVITFDWQDRPANLKAARTLYYSKYDGDCAQITDPPRLESIRSSGLQQQLIEFAMKRTTEMRWVTIDNPRPHSRGITKIYALDDEWLPSPATNFVDPDADSGLLFPIGFFDDEPAVAQFASSKSKTQAQLNAALFEAVNSTDDSCVIKALIAAGSNVNPHNKYGTTPLSIAAADGKLNDVRSLLEAGADPNVRDSDGKTLLWNAEQGHGRYYAGVVQILKKYSAKY
jgi:hypothetical protein